MLAVLGPGDVKPITKVSGLKKKQRKNMTFNFGFGMMYSVYFQQLFNSCLFKKRMVLMFFA